MTLHGAQDLAKRLNELPKAVSLRVQREAARAAAEPMRAEAAALAPRDPEVEGTTLADSIVIGTISQRRLNRQGRSEVVVEVGPSRKPADAFYGYFQEYGTVHHAAQPFMRPAFDHTSRQSLNILLSRLWAAVRKRLPESFGAARTGGGTGL